MNSENVIVKLRGGLGNQMFQFAAGYALSKRLNANLLLDNSSFEKDALRDFALDIYNFNIDFYIPRKKKTIKDFFSNRSLTIFREKFFQYDPSFFDLSADVLIDGYWQTERYFEDFTKDLVEIFSPTVALSSSAYEVKKKILRSNAVSLHIRRGDYVSSADVNRVHGTCSKEYYQQAADFIISKVSDPLTYFVFSDDEEWVKENINLSGEVLFLPKSHERKDWEDLHLMSLCKHNIIANSSFSWWGGWLNQHKDKCVVAPEKWFQDSSKNTTDLLPKSWYKI